MKSKSRLATQTYHKQLYTDNVLFGKGTSWLEKPDQGIINLVKHNFIGRTNIRVLDLGSGVGRNAVPVAEMIGKFGGTITCVDYLDIAIGKLREYAAKYHVSEYIEGVVSPIEEFEIKPDTYDFVIALSVLNHAENKDKMIQIMKDIAQSVRKNGYIFISLMTDSGEYDAETGVKLESDIEVELSFTEASVLLKHIYNGWNIKKLTKNPYGEKYERNGKEIRWTTDYLIFIVKRRN
jgi:tellurite methyltransferase